MDFGGVEFIEDDDSEKMAEWALADPLQPEESK